MSPVFESFLRASVSFLGLADEAFPSKSMRLTPHLIGWHDPVELKAIWAAEKSVLEEQSREGHRRCLHSLWWVLSFSRKTWSTVSTSPFFWGWYMFFRGERLLLLEEDEEEFEEGRIELISG